MSEADGEVATVSDLGATELGVTPVSGHDATDLGSLPDRPSRPRRAPERGELIGRFVVLEVLGTGGMGVVYAAYDPNLDRKVAIKLLRTQVMESDEARMRLLREAQAMARIDHPNVLRVHEAGTYGDQIFIAMEFAGGGTLRHWLADRKRDVREILDVFAQAGRGLAAAHGAGLIHRDFKPDNVLMLADGVARVTDFGLVGVVGEQPPARPAELEAPLSDTTPLSQELTRTGALMGTPAYMAPEQFRGGTVGPAADQFAFCIALYEALYRQRPFGGITFAELCANVVTGEISPAPRETDVPSNVRRVLLRGLAIDATKRYPSMDALLSDLGRDSRRRARVVAWAGASVLAAGAIGFVALRPSAGAECSGAEARLAIAWNPAQQATLTRAFISTQRPDAHAVLDHAVPIVERWGQSWQQAYVGACEDTRVRKIQSEHLLDLRMECLTRALDDARATLDLLAAGGGDAVDHAIDAVRALPSLTPCADPTALTAAIAPPIAGAQPAVAAIRSKVDQARAQRKLGRYAAGLAIAQKALADARALRYPPAIAESLFEVGTLQSLLAERTAPDTLHEAMQVAIAAGANELAIRAGAARVVAISNIPTRVAIADEIVALATALATHAPPSPEAAVELEGATAFLLKAEGHLDQAQSHYDHALAVATAQLGPDAPATITTLRRLGVLAASRHKYDDELRIAKQVMAVEERVAGPDHPDVATSLDNVANAYLDKDQHDPKANQLRERALAIRLAALGPDHPDVAQSYNNLGGIYSKAGDPLTAKTYYEKALVVYGKVYGEDSVGATATMMNLGHTLNDMGDHAGARTLFERTRAILEKAYSADDPRVAPTLNELGILAQNEHKFDEAIALFERASHIVEKVYGQNDSEGIDYIGNLAVTYTQMGKLPEAREATLRTIASMTAFYGAENPQVGAALGNYGFLQLKLDDATGALASFQKADEIFEAKLGKNHPMVSFVLVGKGQALIRLKRHAEATPLLERAVAVATAAHVGPAQTGEMHFYLAVALDANPANHARARTEATAALADYTNARDKGNVETTKRWLRTH